MMGMSAGFSSIFGTPIAGAIFGFEVLFIGTIVYDALLPCLVAAVVGYYTAFLLGVTHTHYFYLESLNRYGAASFAEVEIKIRFVLNWIFTKYIVTIYITL